MSDDPAARFARATHFASTASLEIVEGEMQAFRAQCGPRDPRRIVRFRLAAGAALVVGLVAALVGVMRESGTIVGVSIALGVVLAAIFVRLGASAPPYRDGRRLEKASDFLRALELAPGSPVGVGVDFLELNEAPDRAPAAFKEIAELPRALVVGRPWCVVRATLANGLELILVRSARTHTYVQRGQTTSASHAYWLVDAVAVRYDAQRFPALAAAGAAVQKQIVTPPDWDPLGFHAASGMIAVATITEKKFAEPDYNVRAALDLARQLTDLADPLQPVVALPPRASDVGGPTSRRGAALRARASSPMLGVVAPGQ